MLLIVILSLLLASIHRIRVSLCMVFMVTMGKGGIKVWLAFLILSEPSVQHPDVCVAIIIVRFVEFCVRPSLC